MKYVFEPDRDEYGPCFTVSKVYEGIHGGDVYVASFETESDAAEFCEWKNATSEGLFVTGMCPEVSELPLFYHRIDLGNVRNGYVDMTIDRDFLRAMARWIYPRAWIAEQAERQRDFAKLPADELDEDRMDDDGGRPVD